MSKLLFSLYIVNAVVFAVSLFFSYYGGLADNGITTTSTGNVSDKYYTVITPPGFTFAIWGLIYIFQVAWLAYALTTLCRRNSNGPIYKNPVILSPVFHVCYTLANIAATTFVLTFGNELILAAAMMVWLTTIFGFAALALSFNAIEANKDKIEIKELIASYVLIENGLDIYFSWTFVASCISLAMILQYSDGIDLHLDADVAGSIGLAIFLIGNIPFFILDLTKFRESCKYMYMGYITYLWALGGSLANNYVPGGRNSIITIVAIVLTAVALIAKIVLTIVLKPARRIFCGENNMIA